MRLLVLHGRHRARDRRRIRSLRSRGSRVRENMPRWMSHGGSAWRHPSLNLASVLLWLEALRVEGSFVGDAGNYRRVLGFNDELRGLEVALLPDVQEQEHSDTKSTAAHRLPELGADGTLLCFVPANRSVEKQVLAGTYTSDQLERLGHWHKSMLFQRDADGVAATPDQPTLDTGHQPTLLRADAVAPGVWQRQECVDTAASYLRARMFATNGMFKNQFRTRGPTSPEPQTRCSRDCGFGVFDDALPAAVARDVRGIVGAHAAKILAQKTRTVNMNEASTPDKPDSIIAALLSEPVFALLAEKAKIDPGLLTLTSARLDFGIKSTGSCQLHSDFHSLKTYVFTAIVYLSDWGDTFSGGETVFAHEFGGGDENMRRAVREEVVGGGANDTIAIAATGGLIVQPKFGRVALFTGGAENMHCKMPSQTVSSREVANPEAPKQGSRLVMQLWIKCTTAPNQEKARAKAAQAARKTQLVAQARSWLDSNARAHRMTERTLP